MQICCTTCKHASVHSAPGFCASVSTTSTPRGESCEKYHRKLQITLPPPSQRFPSPARCAWLQSVTPTDSRAPPRLPPQALDLSRKELLLSRGRHGHPSNAVLVVDEVNRPRTSISTVRPHLKAALSRAVHTTACRCPHILTVSSTASQLRSLLEGLTGDCGAVVHCHFLDKFLRHHEEIDDSAFAR